MSSLDFQTLLLPAPVDGGYREPDYWIWCGSVIRGEDGRYHMFASRIPKEVHFSPRWLTNPEVVRAVSDTPEGPYSFADEVLPPRGAAYWDALMTTNPAPCISEGGSCLLAYKAVAYECDRLRYRVSFERPQLLIQDGRPSHLFAAAADGPGGFSRASNTWNMEVPLRS